MAWRTAFPTNSWATQHGLPRAVGHYTVADISTRMSAGISAARRRSLTADQAQREDGRRRGETEQRRTPSRQHHRQRRSASRAGPGRHPAGVALDQRRMRCSAAPVWWQQPASVPSASLAAAAGRSGRSKASSRSRRRGGRQEGAGHRRQGPRQGVSPPGLRGYFPTSIEDVGLFPPQGSVAAYTDGTAADYRRPDRSRAATGPAARPPPGAAVWCLLIHSGITFRCWPTCCAGSGRGRHDLLTDRRTDSRISLLTGVHQGTAPPALPEAPEATAVQ
jgi:hypothetical protein